MPVLHQGVPIGEILPGAKTIEAPIDGLRKVARMRWPGLVLALEMRGKMGIEFHMQQPEFGRPGVTLRAVTLVGVRTRPGIVAFDEARLYYNFDEDLEEFGRWTRRFIDLAWQHSKHWGRE